jgi:hypothetical protein
MRSILAACMVIALAGAAFAQDTPESGQSPFSFRGGIDLGTDVLPTGPIGTDGNITNESWTRVGFQPDFGFGKFGIGIDLSVHFKLYSDPDTPMTFYEGDWVPDYNGNGKTFLDIYLPKFLYVRYGIKGEDPLFAKLGSVDDLTLGNGFIVGNYSNMHFLPETRIFGLDVGLDGSLFGFPYVGFEALTGNLSQFDVIGGRLFARPLIGSSIPILKNMQVGATVVMDGKPYLYVDPEAQKDSVAVYGADVLVPILGKRLVSMAAFGDIAFEPNQRMGAMLGVGGRLLTIFSYGAQVRVLQGGFIPTYFDANYDIYRKEKYDFIQTDASSDTKAGWFGSLGTSFIKDRQTGADKIIFLVSLDGPMAVAPTAPSILQTDYPHLRGIVRVGEGVIGGFYMDGSYEKYFIGREKAFFPDLVDPTDAVMGLSINLKTGSSILTLKYDGRWDPVAQKLIVSSSVQASMKF